MLLHLQQQPNETIQQNRSTWQLLKSTCTNYFYYYAWIATFVLSDSGFSRIVKFTIRYIPKLYHATKSQLWHGMPHNSWTVARLLIRIEQCCILCNFVTGMQWMLTGQFLCIWQSCSFRHAQLHTATISHDKVVWWNCRCDIGQRLNGLGVADC